MGGYDLLKEGDGVGRGGIEIEGELVVGGDGFKEPRGWVLVELVGDCGRGVGEFLHND